MLPALIACGPTPDQETQLQKVTISQSFQMQITPMPTTPSYRCGAWSSNNAPGAGSTIAIYARLTKDVQGVYGATASATAHFRNQDVTLPQQRVSDNGGYVNFTLPLQGRQPKGVPTTVDVTFEVGTQTIHCSPAFFTPQ